jgi:hypothetical protein
MHGWFHGTSGDVTAKFAVTIIVQPIRGTSGLFAGGPGDTPTTMLILVRLAAIAGNDDKAPRHAPPSGLAGPRPAREADALGRPPAVTKSSWIARLVVKRWFGAPVIPLLYTR